MGGAAASETLIRGYICTIGGAAPPKNSLERTLAPPMPITVTLQSVTVQHIILLCGAPAHVLFLPPLYIAHCKHSCKYRRSLMWIPMAYIIGDSAIQIPNHVSREWLQCARYSMWLYNVNVPFLQKERNYCFFKTVGKCMLLLSNGNDRRTLRFQTIQRANSMTTRVPLCSFQSCTNASVVSLVSDCSIAHEIITFCNHSDTVCKTGTVTYCT